MAISLKFPRKKHVFAITFFNLPSNLLEYEIHYGENQLLKFFMYSLILSQSCRWDHLLLNSDISFH